MKLVVWFQVFWLKKWNWLWFHYFKGLKLWNRQSQSGTKWNWRPRRSRVPSVSFFSRRRVPSVSFCFPTDLWRFHNFMPLKIMKPSASFFFDAKKIWNQYRQFHPVFAWNWSTIKIKNKEGFFWNLLFFIKQVNKSRVGFKKKKWKFFGFKKKVKVFYGFTFVKKKKYIFFLVQISTW